MLLKLLTKRWSRWGVIFGLAVSLTRGDAQTTTIYLKNGDRLTGTIRAESTNELVLQTPLLGEVKVPVREVSRREIQDTKGMTNGPAPGPLVLTTNIAAIAAATNQPIAIIGTNKVAKKDEPLKPANPEAQPISATPKFWQHRVDFGLNLRQSTKDVEEFLVIAKSTYAKQPFRHIFDVNFNYARTDGLLSSHRLIGSEKTEYQITKKSYVFNLIGGGYDEIRLIDVQYEVGPGFGMELINSSKHKFVWKGEIGLSFQQQYRSDGSEIKHYSARIAEIFAWRIWDKLTADAKIEFFPSLADFGEWRLRLESTLSYPVTDRLSLNLVVIDLYDTLPAKGTPNNDLQVRSTIGIKF